MIELAHWYVNRITPDAIVRQESLVARLRHDYDVAWHAWMLASAKLSDMKNEKYRNDL